MPVPAGQQPHQNWQAMFFMIMWGILMVVLFLTRPQGLRGGANKNRRYVSTFISIYSLNYPHVKKV